MKFSPDPTIGRHGLALHNVILEQMNFTFTNKYKNTNANTNGKEKLGLAWLHKAILEQKPTFYLQFLALPAFLTEWAI